MWEVCHSGFHWKLISGPMGLPNLLATSSIPLEFSLWINPWEKAEEWWTGSRMVNAGLAGEYWDPRGCLIFTFSHAPSLAVLQCLRAHFWKPESAQLAILRLLFHSPAKGSSLYPPGWSSLWMFPRLGFLPYAALPDGRWEMRQYPSAIPHGKDRQCFLPCDQWPKTQVSSFGPWRPFLLIALRLGRACSDLTHKSFLGPGHRESASLWCLIWAHGRPSLASPYH